MHRIFDLIAHERFRQNAKWGEQNHDPLFWLAILGEEFGEVAKEITEFHALTLVARANPEADTAEDQGLRLSKLRSELIQTAAVAVAMLESLERNQDVTL